MECRIEVHKKSKKLLLLQKSILLIRAINKKMFILIVDSQMIKTFM